MPEAHSFYQGRSFNEGHIWWFIEERIGQDLRERYDVYKDLPPELLTLVRKLDDSDWLFPSVSRENDVDLFGG
jgi:hypothetical protein